MASPRRRTHVSLDLLKGFEAAARHLSFTRAAHELFLTQSAISREIKRLEEQLGVALFSRVNRGLKLTDAGQRLYRAVAEALSLVNEATEGLASSQGPETLTVTTSAPLASLWLVPRLPNFVRAHPHVDVRSVASDRTLDLERERIDMAIRWAPEGAAVPEGSRLFAVQMFPVSAPQLARDPQRPLRIASDLAQHVLLDLDTATRRGPWSDWGPWLQAMKLDKLKPKGALRFSHYDQVVQAAIDGTGVAIGRTPHNVRQLREGKLIAPLGKEAVKPWGSYYMVVAARAAKRRIVDAFVAWLESEARQDEKAGTRTDHRARK